jgi:hypothetical protein
MYALCLQAADYAWCDSSHAKYVACIAIKTRTCGFVRIHPHWLADRARRGPCKGACETSTRGAQRTLSKRCLHSCSANSFSCDRRERSTLQKQKMICSGRNHKSYLFAFCELCCKASLISTPMGAFKASFPDSKCKMLLRHKSRTVFARNVLR